MINDYKNKKMNRDEIFKKFPWLNNKDMKMIISPDLDGISTALLLKENLGWEIEGFFDTKTMLTKNPIIDRDKTVFIDIEILDSRYKSIGQHLQIHSYKDLPKSFKSKTKNVVSPNLMREVGRIHDFGRKYPMGTYHFVNEIFLFDKQDKREGLSLLADGTRNSILKYHKNFNDWNDWFNSPKTIFDIIKEKTFANAIDTYNEALDDSMYETNSGFKIKVAKIDVKKAIAGGYVDDYVKLINNISRKYFETSALENSFKYVGYFVKDKIEGSKANNKFIEAYEDSITLAMTSSNVIEYTHMPEWWKNGEKLNDI